MIACLMGPSASGKSTLAKRLQQWRPDLCARVPVDFFFVPRPVNVTMPRYLTEPFGYDWDSVDRAIVAQGADRSTPDCDFDEMLRRSETGGLPIAEAPVYVLDGMRPHPRCEYVVMLELDAATQRQRLTERDARWGTRVADRGAHLTATFEQGCAELPRAPDLHLPAADPIDQNARRILEALG